MGIITLVGRLVWLMAQKLWLGSDGSGGPIGWEGNMYMVKQKKSMGGGGGGVGCAIKMKN